jgi:drug/metabolite transporter (DMT)-like permease
LPAPFPYAGEACALASSLLWAGAGVVFARVRPHVTPGALNLGKNLAALLLFALLFTVLQGHPWPSGVGARSALLFALSGFVGLTLCDTLFLRALRTIGPQRATLLLAVAPVLVAVAALLPPFEESPSALAWGGMGLCVAGVALSALRRSPEPHRAEEIRRGVRYGLAAAVFQAGGVLLTRLALQGGTADAAAGTSLRLAAGVTGLLVLGAATGRLGRWTGSLRRERAWWPILVAASFGTFLGIWANTAGLEWSAHAGVASTLNSLAPVFLIPLSAAFLAERFDRRAWIATALAVTGIALISLD